MKRIILVAVFIALLSVLLAQDTNSIERAVSLIVTEIVKQIPDNSKIAVTNIRSKNEQVSSTIVDQITQGLINTQRFDVISRPNMNTARAGLNFSINKEVGTDKELELGKSVEATIIVCGSYYTVSDMGRLKVQAMSTETSRIADMKIVILRNNVPTLVNNSSQPMSERSGHIPLRISDLLPPWHRQVVPPKDKLKDKEKLVFDIRYGVITAGTATLSTEKVKIDGQDVWLISTSAETNSVFDKVFKVRDYVESIATLDELYSYKFTKRLNEGRYRQHRVQKNFLYGQRSIYSRYQFKEERFVDELIEIPEATYDVLSAFYKVRTMELKQGQSITLNVTVDGKNYDIKVNILRRESINTAIGRKDCFVVEPILQGDAIFKQTGKILVWLTDDDEKIPVLMSSKVIFGSFQAVLREATTL